MLKISYVAQIILLVIWIVVVTVLFKTITDRQVAAAIAGLGFILFPLVFLISEISHTKNKWHIFSIVLFLLVSALPIFGLRILNWGVAFETLSIMGISANFLHKISSYLYLLILLTAGLGFFMERKKS